MLEKLLQAAIITFLLHLIAGLNPSNTIDTQVEKPSINTPVPIARVLPRSAQ